MTKPAGKDCRVFREPYCGEAEIEADEDGNQLCPVCGIVRVKRYPEGEIIIHNDPKEAN